MVQKISVSNEKDITNPYHMTFEERQAFLKKEEEDKKRKVRRSPYDNFVQFNRDMYKAEDWLMKESPIAYRIFKFLVNNMDNYNAVACSYKVLQEYFEVSQVTVARAIKLLKEKQYIEVYKSGTSNIYYMNKELVWNSWGTNFNYAKFGANIIISESEQEKSIKSKKLKTITKK